MLTEVKAAVRFLTQVLLKNVGSLPSETVESFGRTLEKKLCSHYRGHWFPERPHKGSAFRCIRINHKMDPLLADVGKNCGIFNLSDLFPLELTLWVDPYEVCFRVGENGSIGTLYSEGSQQGSGQHAAEARRPNGTDLSTPTRSSSAANAGVESILSTCKDQFLASTNGDPPFRRFAAFVAS